ncbi:hypothetical protein HNP84_001107 [Thermocatellispora tengchongensis]|uniref:Uncharacterized protein n=1 Tax=Thermocatellispora tengchongensis TaxID=1073253 RepID=A0A840P0H7_9ACTN|nr:hypothetical protein [Thermocatellispora tengchongensis]
MTRRGTIVGSARTRIGRAAEVRHRGRAPVTPEPRAPVGSLP